METAEKTNTSRVINIVFFLLLALILIGGYLFISNTLRGEAAEMAELEGTLPVYALDDYVASLNDAKWRELAADTLSLVNTDFQTEDECFAFLKGLIGEKFYWAPGETDNEYIISNADYTLGTVSLSGKPGEKPAVTEESFDFSFIFRSEEITVPEGYSVWFGEKKAGTKYIIDDSIEYPYLEHLYTKTDMKLPHMCRYKVDNLFGDETLTARNLEGKSFDVSSVGDGTSLFTPVEGSEAEQIYYLSQFFFREFVPMSCGLGGNPYLYITADSPLWDRFRRFESLYYHTAGYELNNFEANAVYRISPDLCVADIRFDTVGYTYYSTAKYSHNCKLLFANGPGVTRIITFTEY